MNSNIYNILKVSEGLRLNAYQDVVGVWTIGIGATFYQDGTKVKKGDKITEKQAIDLCEYHFETFKKQVQKVVKSNVNSNQLDALTLFAFNLGIGSLTTSTLLKKVNANPNDPNIEIEFNKWIYAGKKVYQNLVKRRKSEVAVYFSKTNYSSGGGLLETLKENKNKVVIGLLVFFYSFVAIII